MDTHKKHGFWHRYFFSLDHKDIGFQYLLTAMFMAAFGGFFVYVFRYNLAFGPNDIPLYGDLAAKQYNQLVTNHGAIMIFWVGMPILLAVIGNFLIPLMIGTDDMAFPTLNKISYWVFLLSCIVLLLGFLMPTGAFGGGWTMYPPLSVSDFGYNNPNTTFWSNFFTGNTFFLLAVALEFVSMLMGGINFVVTTLNKRAKGMSLMQLPIVVWMVNIANLLFMFSVGPLIAGAFMLLMDILVGTGFFDAYRGGDPILWQHLFWFFGHPEVYVLLLPSIGAVGEIVSTFSRKPLFGYRMIILLVIIAAILSLVVWAHHQFVSGIDPGAANIFSVLTIIISIPFAGLVLSYLATLWKGDIKLELPMLWALGMLATFTFFGGFTGLHLGSNVFDIYAHDTYFVIAHFHYTLFPTVFLGGFAAFYYWYPKFSGRMMNKTLGLIHFWGTFIFFNSIFIPLFWLGLQGQHRRIYNYSMWNDLLMQPEHILARQIATVSLIFLLLVQFVFLFNFFYSLKKGKKAPKNPWHANTLEWQAVSPPPHGNFNPYPVVHRWPYDYNHPDKELDYCPQNES